MEGACIKCKEYYSSITTEFESLKFNVCFDCVLEILTPDLTEEAKMYDDYFFVDQATDEKCENCFCNADGWKWSSFYQMFTYTYCLDCIHTSCTDFIRNDS